MFGSDWPVCLLAGGYGEALDLVRSTVSQHEVADVLGGTALRTYGISGS
jgi:L-fuconolactonase